MKKFYTLLALAVITLAGAVSASARDYYTAVGFDEMKPLADITPGQTVVLQTASAGGEAAFLIPTGKTQTLSDNALYVFELADPIDGEETYYLKHVATGKYLSQSGATTYVDSKVQAFRFYAKHPEQWYYRNEDVIPLDCDPRVIATYDDTHWGGQPGWPEAYVFTDVTRATSEGWSPSEETQKAGREDGAPWRYFAANWGTGAPFIAPWTDTNTWYLFEVAKVEGFEYLDLLLKDLFGAEGTPATVFTEGDQIGQVPSQYFQALVEVFNEAQGMLIDSTLPAEEYTDCANRLEAAYNACVENTVKFKAGTYRMRIRPVEGNASYPEGAYAYATSARAEWVAGDYEIPEELTVDDAKFIWQFIPNTEVENGYYIKNFGQNKFLGYVASRSNAIPMTATAETTYIVTVNPYFSGSFLMVPQQTPTNALHGDRNYHTVVYWTTDAGASAWIIEPVAQEDVDAIQEQVDLARRNAELSSLVPDAEALYASTLGFDTDATADDNFTNHGILANLWTNAPEPSEGPLTAANDGDLMTYFHSRWSSNAAPLDGGQFHNIIVELSEDIDAVSVKMAKRQALRKAATDETPEEWTWSNTYQNNNAPYLVHFYGSNDVTKTTNEEEVEVWTSDNWVDEGAAYFTYNISSTHEDASAEEGFVTWDNIVGINNKVLSGKYKYIRMDVEQRMGGATGWFNFGEVAIFKAKLNNSKGIIATIPAEVVSALLAATDKAKGELITEEATQATIDELKAAIEAYENAIPDPDALREAIADARELANGAEEGAGVGYFQTGAAAALNAALNAVEATISDQMTAQQVQDGKKAVADAVAAFNAKLNKPVNGAYYRIKSTSSAEAQNGSYLRATGSGESQIRWNGSKTDANVASKLNYIWQVVANEDGTFSFKNAFTGTYMGVTTRNDIWSQPIYMSAEPKPITLEFAKVAGNFNLRQAEGVYANTDPQGGLVTWMSHGANDNSSFAFEPEEDNAWTTTQFLDETEADVHPHVCTLPFAIEDGDRTIYTILGINLEAKTLELKATKNLAAGVPFIYFAVEGETGFNVYPVAQDLEEIEYATEAATVNGLVGVLGAENVAANFGFLYNGYLLKTANNEAIAANTGYFVCGDLPQVNEAGDMSIPVDDPVIQYIKDNVGITNVNATLPTSNATYDLTGRRVQKAQQGLYIINGKKVLVK